MFRTQLANFSYALIFILVSPLRATAFDEHSDATSARSIWAHNGSTVYLVADGTQREFHYQEPRQGMKDAGAREGSLLFKGSSSHGRYFGTAYLFNHRCGQIAYDVSGPILDDSKRVLLQGKAPRVSVDCKILSYFLDTLEFELIKSPDSSAHAEVSPSEFIGIWLQADSENKICKATDWGKRTGDSSVRLVKVTEAALQGSEFSCKFVSVKRPANHLQEQAAIDVELFCAGEGGMTWNSSEHWSIHTIADRRNIGMVSLKTWNYRDNSGQPIQTPPSNNATSEFLQCD